MNGLEIQTKMYQFSVMYSRSPEDFKFGHFKSMFPTGSQPNMLKLKYPSAGRTARTEIKNLVLFHKY